jgi:peroxin-1
MPSKRKAAPMVVRDVVTGFRGSSNSRDQEIALVEIDATLANTLGLTDGSKVMASIHVDPPQAHTINIEPLTPEDWEIIELHATFLELNMLSQIRALPNPAFALPAGSASNSHPLTLHLSPTSTANIKIVSLDPVPPTDVPFAKIAPGAEVIVAPKTRSKPSTTSGGSGSVASTSKSKWSGTSTVRRRSAREEKKPSLFLRGIERASCGDYFDEENELQDNSVWVDGDLLSGEFKGVHYVSVTVIRPAGLQDGSAQKAQPEQDPSSGTLKPATKIIARIRAWDDPPNSQTAALSSPLCTTLGCRGMVGGVVKIEPAPLQLPRDSVQTLKVYPFATSVKNSVGLKFGGESKAEKEEAAKRFKHIYGSATNAGSLLAGPLTDGALLGLYPSLEVPTGWEGGLVKFEPGPSADANKSSPRWVLGLEPKVAIDVQPPIQRPAWPNESSLAETSLTSSSLLVGIDSLLNKLQIHLSHLSSTLLTGGLGAGKTSVAKSLAERLQRETLFHTTYFPCRTLVNDESRMATIKDTLNQLFMAASWGARLGGKALVILDDLDRLCPVETELQVGNDNSRSRQISETVCAIVRQFCTRSSGVVLLATAEGKDSLNNVIISGHAVREIIELKAPDKEGRRKILEAITKQDSVAPVLSPGLESIAAPSTNGSRPATADGSAASEDTSAWMDGASQASGPATKNGGGGFLLNDDLDFLDIAGLTDGYMPGDITLLVSRARNEAIIRAVTEPTDDDPKTAVVPLGRADFDNAVKGFTPASLRNVSLQTSSTSFSSIGGLQETRRILLETLQYPTKYAPIFAQCPLRLRSGLLLYGYPGCGKTLLASAVAGECGLNFISVKGPEILNKYIGASEKSVRDLFERASAAKPCVLFFDEFDSIAPKRGHDSTGVTDRVVNQLLTQMDGAEGLSGVYVLAATSRPDLIDPALLRPGRLDKSLLCDMPNAEDRVDILKALSGKVRLDGDLTESSEAMVELGRLTEGFSGADLQALFSNAQLEAIHDVLQDPAGLAADSRRRVNGHNGPQRGKGSSVPSFVQFQYGEPTWPAQNGTSPANSKSAELAERAAILAKLESIKQARKRTKEAQKGQVAESDAKAVGDTKEVVISWRHFVKALEGTRASISSDERNRLARIYHEFVVGRSGDLRDGQGSMEIGGRSSLM